MGRTLPTITQALNEAEAMLARFRRALRKHDQYIFDGLFASARLHIVAISQTESLLPFEAIHTLITDAAAPQDFVQQLRESGIQVILAPLP